MSDEVYVLVFAVLWLACGLAAAGMIYAHVQRRWPSVADEDRREDAEYAVAFGLFGPIALVIIFLMTGFAKHGWLFPGSKP
jgi:hypothetical protein